ncbi:MAG: DUF6680 family protein [Vampirovibrionales bacterium]|nr:DUF6680 family protein [Vampirovibrionales bacterium]
MPNIMIQDASSYLVIIGIIQIFLTGLSLFVSLRVQAWLQARDAAAERRLNIFRVLMTTRNSRLAPAHVEALNSIDLEFYSNKDKYIKVLHAWETYRDSLNTDFSQKSQVEIHVEIEAREIAFNHLLSAMGEAVNKHFSPTALRRNGYSPTGYYNDEIVVRTLRQQIIDLTKKGYVEVVQIEPSVEVSQTD